MVTSQGIHSFDGMTVHRRIGKEVEDAGLFLTDVMSSGYRSGTCFLEDHWPRVSVRYFFLRSSTSPVSSS